MAIPMQALPSATLNSAQNAILWNMIHTFQKMLGVCGTSLVLLGWLVLGVMDVQTMKIRHYNALNMHDICLVMCGIQRHT